MSEINVDKSEEPSIMSTDPKERILARRLRIQRRLESMMKKEDEVEDESIDEQTSTEKQIDASAELMQKLVAEGDEVISNIRIANDGRELQRREEDYGIRQLLLQKLEEEAQESMIKYTNINAKWSELLESKDPLDIHNGIESQMIKCQEVLAQKDVIIGDFKKAIDNADNKFVEDQKRQNEDIDLLIDRIDNQMKLIYKAYHRELMLIDDTLKDERTDVLQNVTKRWNSLYEERQTNELEGVERRREIMREYEEEMNRVLIEHQEQYRARKIWLETECQKLQQQVENMKALCLINLEKFDYSYAILQKRESENIIVKNQQRKRINKLQDMANDLKKNYTEIEVTTRAKIEKLKDEINKAKKNIENMESKSNHFTTINDRQFMQIWEMNTKNADKLLDQIFKVDKIIYEQMLGLEWVKPEESLLKKEDLTSYCEAMEIIEHGNAEQDNNFRSFRSSINEKSDKSPEVITLEKKLLRHIMIQIADEAGFLIEDKVLALLSQYTRDNQVIVKLDHVYQALNITSEDQIYLLINMLLPYTYCPTCITEREDEINESLLEQSYEATEEYEDKEPEISEDVIGPCNSPEFNERAARLKREVLKYITIAAKDDEDEDNNDTKSSVGSMQPTTHGSNAQCNNIMCDKGHLLAIQSANVIRVLGDITTKCREEKCDTRGNISQNLQEKVSFPDNKVVLSRSISERDMREYWRRYRDIFSSKKEKLWDALMIGLQKYHEILKERHKLMNETDRIQRQNDELRQLLGGCGSKNGVSAQRKAKSANKVV